MKGVPGFVRRASACGVWLLGVGAQVAWRSTLGQDAALLLHVPAVLACAVWLGAGAGLAATALGAVLAVALGPQAPSPWWEPEGLAALALFLGSGGAISLLATTARRDRKKLTAAALSSGLEGARVDRARGELRDREAHLQAILDTAIEGILSIDEQGRVEEINKAAQRMFGYTAAEVVGQNIKLLMPGPYREEHDGYLGAYRATGLKKIIGIGREVRGIRKDGTVFPIDLAVSEVQLGERRTFTGFIRDLTERKRLELEFLRAQKMEAVGGLAGGIAHDFNNLLMGILAFSRMAREGLDAEATREAFDEIGGAANRGIALTRRLLAFTRGRALQPLAPTSIDAVMRENEAMLRQLLGEDIAITMRLSDSGACLLADEGLIEQILVNLMINARDAMPTGGEIVVTTRETQDAPPRVELEVRDNGCGMPEDVRTRIFEPFFTTKDPAKGTGLGLSTVKRIVDQLGGRIEVESRVGHGTTFRLSFPRSAAAAGSRNELTPRARRPSERATILVVEDDRLVRSSIRRYLEGLEYRVLAADGPAEAMASVRSAGPVDVLLTDMALPGTNGHRLAQEILALTPRARVIYMSAHPAEYLRERKQLEADSIYLQKPFELEALAELLRSVLDAPRIGRAVHRE